MSVILITDELLEDLNNGKTIDIEVGPIGFTLASEKWLSRMKEMDNIKEDEECHQ